MTIKTTRAAGIVLDPVQLAEELTTLKQKPRHDGHALLCELPDAVVRLLENPTIPTGHALRGGSHSSCIDASDVHRAHGRPGRA
jgi:hypothetical protein